MEIENQMKISINRQDFITVNRIGKTLDVGINDGSGWDASHRRLGREFDRNNDWLYGFDCDEWMHPNMVRGDAHHLPFIDNAFDTVVMGDVLEHVVDTFEVLQEVYRVADKRVILTVPNEHVWHESLSPFKDLNEHLDEVGKTEEEEAYDNTIGHCSTYSKCLDYVPENKMNHLNHLRQFNFRSFSDLLSTITNDKDLISFNTLYHYLGGDAVDMGYFAAVIDIGKAVHE